MRYSLLIIVLFYSSFVFSQETKLITRFQHLEVKDGLPENDVKGFLSDADNGYWFRTTNYVVYYNGHDFISYGKDRGLFTIDNKGIQSFNIQKNILYVFGLNAADKINCITKKPENLFKDTTGLGIKAGYFTRKGHLLIVFRNGDIVQVLPNKLKKLYSLQMFAFCTMAETKEGDILVSNFNKDIAVFSSDLKLLNHVKLPDPIVHNGDILNYNDLGTIAVANRRILKYDPIRHDFDSIKLDHELGRLFLHDGDQNYIVKGFNKVVQYDRTSKRNIELNISLNYNYSINKVSFDGKRKMVFCTNQGVVLYKPPHAFITYPQPQALNNQEFNTTRRAILETPDKKIIFISYRYFDEYDPFSGKIQPFSKDQVDGYAGYIMGDNLFVGSDGTGMYKLSFKNRKAKGGSSYKKYFSERAMHITSISKYKDKILLLGLSGSACNLKLYDTGKDSYEDFLLTGLKDPAITEKVNSIIDDSTYKWICTNGGLFRIVENKVDLFLGSNELGTNEVNYIYKDGNSVLWIATGVGIIKYDLHRKKVIQKLTNNDGLAGNKCLSILADNYNTIWVPTYTGLSRVDVKGGRIWNYYMQDGFTDNEYNFASFLKASTGDLYFGGLNGFVRVRPTPPVFVDDNKATVKIDHVVLHKKNGDELLDIENLRELKMHTSDDRLSISFSIKEHLSPEYVRYFYKIDGIHKDWISLERQNKLDLAFLPSGKYSLHIKSGYAENKNEFYQVTIPIFVTINWYETKLFYFILALMVILSVISIFYGRYKTLQELEKIRTDLANDIHDEIGTMLTRSIMRLELLKGKKIIDVEGVTKVEKQLRNTVQSFRNVLWSLNTDNVRVDDFVGRLNALLEDTFEGTHFGFLVTNLSPDNYFQKSIHIKRNLLLIVKELAHNAIKHSKGDFFEIVISNDGRKWKILVADNGKNDNFGIPESGIGMSSLAKRVASINGTIDIDKRENGFFVTIFL